MQFLPNSRTYVLLETHPRRPDPHKNLEHIKQGFPNNNKSQNAGRILDFFRITILNQIDPIEWDNYISRDIYITMCGKPRNPGYWVRYDRSGVSGFVMLLS